MAVVKANAYGHGAVEVSRTLLANGADRLGVALLQEALELRQEGFAVPILILGFTPSHQLEAVVRANIAQTIFSYEQAWTLSRVAGELGKKARVHVKIDTGMGRLGFPADDQTVKTILRISRLPNLEIEGIFTHFATADEKDKTFTRYQFEQFQWVVEELKAQGLEIPLKHAANSAAIIDLPETHLDLVRPGISLYGIYPSPDVCKDRINLIPAMTFKTQIAFLKRVRPGTSISYGRTYVAKEERVIATLPLGYADGYSRALSNRGKVLVKGKKVPIVGRVCMDQTMIDVTEVSDVRVGDEVVLFGREGREKLPVEEVAGQLGTIAYEVVCMVSSRVPRVYFRSRRKN